MCSFVEPPTHADTLVYTSEYQSYNVHKHVRETVCHGAKEWTRDVDGDGRFETRANSSEGIWTGLRNFLCPFQGVHKRELYGYGAVDKFSINLKAISPSFIATRSQYEPNFYAIV